MRKTLIALILASAFAPTAANAQDWDQERGSRTETERSDRSSRREKAREARPQGADPVERREQSASPDRAPKAERSDRQVDSSPRINQSPDLERAMRSNRMLSADRPARVERPTRVGRTDRETQPVEQAQVPVTAQPVQQSGDKPDNLVDYFRQYRPGDTADGGKNHDKDHDWSHDWRKDKRYDWWKYRNSYRSLYRLGNYYDPYGWTYRRWTVGYSLWPSYYGSHYWLNDPSMYRLPPVYGPYRWVRYYDDALLVNIYTGHVVDVIYNFFW
jgi:hypothetical protein